MFLSYGGPKRPKGEKVGVPEKGGSLPGGHHYRPLAEERKNMGVAERKKGKGPTGVKRWGRGYRLTKRVSALVFLGVVTEQKSGPPKCERSPRHDEARFTRYDNTKSPKR